MGAHYALGIPMRRYAAGSGRRLGGRSRTRLSTASGARDSGPHAKGRAPAPPKQPDALPECQATCRARLAHALPPEPRRPVRVLSQDESCVGVRAVRRGRRPARGVQTVGAVPHVCAWYSGAGAVAPTTGERCFGAWPSLQADRFPLGLEAWTQVFPDRINLVLLDSRGAHTAHPLRWPEHVRDGWWPPYGPALSPLARV
jgi:hypothetical protein